MQLEPSVPPSGKESKFRARIVISPQKASSNVVGAYGGNDGHGQVVMHLYNEYPTIPEAMDVEPIPGGGSAKQTPVRSPEHAKFTREVCGTFTMQTSVARSLGKWLIDNADLLDVPQKATARPKENE